MACHGWRVWSSALTFTLSASREHTGRGRAFIDLQMQMLSWICHIVIFFCLICKLYYAFLVYRSKVIIVKTKPKIYTVINTVCRCRCFLLYNKATWFPTVSRKKEFHLKEYNNHHSEWCMKNKLIHLFLFTSFGLI